MARPREPRTRARNRRAAVTACVRRYDRLRRLVSRTRQDVSAGVLVAAVSPLGGIEV